MTASVKLYTAMRCPYCDMAKQFLQRKSITYQEIHVDNDPASRRQMIAISGQRSVPQIVINNEAIGGYTDLLAINKSGRLDVLLQSQF